MSRVVVVGGGIAAVSTIRSVREAGFTGEVTLVSGEDEPPYDRPPLSKQYLVGTMTTDHISLFAEGELESLGVQLVLGRRAAGLDSHRQVLQLIDGSELHYDALVIATGCATRRLPWGNGQPGVHYLRNREDADAIKHSLAASRRVVIIGAGFIGLELASGAQAAGLDVTVLEAASAPLTRVLGPDLGEGIVALHSERGVAVHFGAAVLGIEREGGVNHVIATIDDTLTRFEAETVLVGVGAIPQTDWINDSRVLVDNGVVANSRGQTAAPNVYAAGDVSRWVNEATGQAARIEQWQAAVEQGGIVGANLAIDLGASVADRPVWNSVPYFWSDQYEHKLQFCGKPGPVSITRDLKRGRVTGMADAEDGHLCGILTIDAPAALARGRRLVSSGASWDEAQSWIAAL